MLSVLHLDPAFQPATPIRPIDPLRDDPLQTHAASRAEEIGADRADLKRIDEDTIRPAAKQPLQIGLAHGQRQRAQILAVHGQHVKGAKLNLGILLPGVQRAEIGDAVNAQNDSLAINHELLAAVLQRGLHDPGIAPGPVVAAASDQPYLIAIALQTDAEAVVFDLMKPILAGWDGFAEARQAKLEFAHAAR